MPNNPTLTAREESCPRKETQRKPKCGKIKGGKKNFEGDNINYWGGKRWEAQN